MLLEGLDVRVQRAEQEAAVGLEARDLGEVVRALLVEALRVGAVAAVLDLEQLAAVAERPAVERAGERGAVVRLASAQHGPAVRAGVDDAVQLLILVPGDHDGGAADVGRVVVADVRDLRLVGQVDPVPLEDVLHLELEDLLVGEDLALGADHAVLAVVDDGVVDDVVQMAQVLSHVSSWSVDRTVRDVPWDGCAARASHDAVCGNAACLDDEPSLEFGDGAHIRGMPSGGQGVRICWFKKRSDTIDICDMSNE